MIEKVKTIFSIPELRDKIFFTFSILIVVRIGAHIPIPGVDANALAGAFDRLQDTLFGLFNMFVGGAFEKASLFSLGIISQNDENPLHYLHLLNYDKYKYHS